MSTTKKDLVYLQHRIDSPNTQPREKLSSRLHYVYEYEGGSRGSDEEEDSLGSDGGEDDNMLGINGKKISRWTKLHNVLKVVQGVERQKALEEAEEEERRKAALSPVKKVSCKGNNGKSKGDSKRRSIFATGGGSGTTGMRKRGFSSSTSGRFDTITTLLLEGHDRDDTLYHIVSKNMSGVNHQLVSPQRPQSAKSIVKRDDLGIKASKYVMDYEGPGSASIAGMVSKDDGHLGNQLPATPIRYKQSRNRLFRHNSEANFSKISRFERVNSLPKRSGLKEVVNASSTCLFEHPNYRPPSPRSRSRSPGRKPFQPEGSGGMNVSIDCNDDDSTASSAMMVNLLHALGDSVPRSQHRGTIPLKDHETTGY
jgi:hypothetical protein